MGANHEDWATALERVQSLPAGGSPTLLVIAVTSTGAPAPCEAYRIHLDAAGEQAFAI